MVNDLPEVTKNVETSLFADDSAVFKSGKNLKQIASQIQSAITNIQKWCEEWGFKISAEKTIGVVFTNALKPAPIHIKINNNEIKIEEKVKFLGVIFDKKLTWGEHIKLRRRKMHQTIKLDAIPCRIYMGIQQKRTFDSVSSFN